jgi:hypothetical protein
MNSASKPEDIKRILQASLLALGLQASASFLKDTLR